MKPTAIVLTHGLLDSIYAKTCHGLLRGTERYEIVAVIDHKFVGTMTGEIVSGSIDVPIHASVSSFLESGDAPDWCIVGVAFEGGRMPHQFKDELLVATRAGTSVLNGLHTLLRDDPGFMAVAAANGAEVVDIRAPKGIDDLHFWSGKIKEVKAPRIPVLGTDCAVGKRTTSKRLNQALRDQGIISEMIYTGQTGWLEGHNYGLILDSTLNDFVSGELEHAVYQCDTESSPDVILIEGQSSLRNPSGPCGSELIISLQARHVILQHDPLRAFFDDDPALGFEIPSVQSEIDLIRTLGAEVIAVSIRADRAGNGLSELRQALDVPVIVADDAGIDQLVEIVAEVI